MAELTIKSYALDVWIPQRKKNKPLAWRDNLSWLNNHVLPLFGPRPLAWVDTAAGTRAIRIWATVELQQQKAQHDEEPLADRSVRNILSTFKVMLGDAVWQERLAKNPLDGIGLSKRLGRCDDKDGTWRNKAGFDLEQIVSLTTDRRLPPERLMLYALAFLTGGRTGEVSNLRWRDWTDSYKGQLGRLLIATSFNTRNRIEKSTKTNVEKWIPVHPFLARTLQAWHEGGWRDYTGREPTPEDLIVPRGDGGQWGNGQRLKRFHLDLDTLGMPRQRQYENRSSFRMLLINAGAEELLVNRMTHPSPKQASDLYTRTDKIWPAMCGAIRLLRHPGWEPREPVPLRPVPSEALPAPSDHVGKRLTCSRPSALRQGCRSGCGTP